MFMKKLSIVLVPMLFLTVGGQLSTVSAHMLALNATTRAEMKTTLAADHQTNISARADLEHSNADKEIERRVTALNEVTVKINGMKRVTNDQKTSLLVQVQTAISDLNTLKAKIDANSDPATLKSDKQSIVNSYRVFLLLIPKVNLMAHADLALQLSSQMTTNDTLLETKIQAAKDAGKDVTAVQALMSDRKAKIADAQTQANTALTSVSSLTPDGYPGNKPTLLAGRDILKVARKDLSDSYQDLIKMNDSLKAMK